MGCGIAAQRGPAAVKPHTTKQREAYWRQHTEAYVASGLTVRAYCPKQTLAESAFCYWRARLAKHAQACATYPDGSTPSGITAMNITPASITPVARQGYSVRFAEFTLAPKSTVLADVSSVPNAQGTPAIPAVTPMSADGIEAVLPGGIRLVIGAAVPVERVASLLRALSC